MVSARVILGACGVLALVAGGCEEILHLEESSDRFVDPHLSCADGTCVCIDGFDNCDGNDDNGCEADLSRSPNCGACGVACTNGACVASACACSPGFGDCDGDPTNGCEARTAQDPGNCGACGHSCLGGVCQAGVCQPVTVTGVDGAESIAAANGRLYAALCGDAPVEVEGDGDTVATLAVLATGCGHLVSITGDQLFWADGQSVFRNPLDMATAPTQLAAMAGPKQLFAASPTHVYWWGSDPTTMAPALVRVPIAGGQVELIVDDAAIAALAVDPTAAYWSDATGIHSVPFNNTTLTLLSAGPATALAADSGDLYVGDAMGLEHLATTGGAISLLAPAVAVGAIAVDSSFVYWADHGDASLKRVGRDGSALTVLATGEPFSAGTPIAMDDEAVYWIAGQQVRRLAK